MPTTSGNLNSNPNKLSLNDKLLASKHSTPIPPPKTTSTQDNLIVNDTNNIQPTSNHPIDSSQVKVSLKQQPTLSYQK
ncbi:unnamed protein product [Macrosiphum euphorbiae]|uniref:Uncharacterized protein n=1 Tax=Macrosiphum euphorbiae TaxID=13131 RepID=A0AAV0X522_9HEMI|nr:unnamed protein product [Macrosiphum euphorbiae]